MCSTNALRLRNGTRRRSGRRPSLVSRVDLIPFPCSSPLQEYDLQNALDAQQRLGSAKIRAVPIPNLYEDANSQSIYPPNVELPKQLIRLQRTLTSTDALPIFDSVCLLALQLESDEPEYDMDKSDHDWFNSLARVSCPNLTCLEYETIVDKLENASTRILISLDEARILLPNVDESHVKAVYDFWRERRTAQVHSLNFTVLERMVD